MASRQGPSETPLEDPLDRCNVFWMGQLRIPYRKPAGTTWDQLQEALLRALGK